ncbi:mitochondrial carnitine/acylcarnitine carrier protein-like [Pocillopora damicornis]|uniref:mitochondrial carnitine/acylcarnitine carrier protein-like n=1 Tax=Pocillopora damicornis TaxID=46731 RepID=UPI000F557CEF|nr:mitochondrial carnitine/acylcarnitine carrier protein-like [Pocillopora damicornis]
MESSSTARIESGGKVQQGRSTSGVRNFLAGGFGGVCGVTIGHPFDTIKVRIQTTPSPKPGQEAVFKGTLDCLLKTLRNELKAHLHFQSNRNFQNFTSGMFGGFCAAAIVTPGDRIKCLLQIQQSSGGERKYKGPLNCAKQLYKEKGIRSLYRGTFATLLRDVPSIGVYFCSYEWILSKLTLEGESRENLNPLRIFIAGVTAPEGTYPRRIRDAFRQLVKEEGVASLFKGVTPVFPAFPANAGE